MLWYTPPFNNSVTTNFGKRFLRLIDIHFGQPRRDNLHKIINRHTVKIGYSCTPNIKSIISSHNTKVLQRYRDEIDTQDQQIKKECNCRISNECPVEQKCLTSAVLYKATLTATEPTNNKIHTATYIGSTESTFKQRYTNHKASLRHTNKRYNTTLADYFWDCKDKNMETDVKWQILQKSSKYRCGSRKCNLCLTEKRLILFNKDPNNLNKRNELMARCPHMRKWRLDNFE